MITEAKYVLETLEAVLKQLTNEQYTQPCEALEKASVGAHSRHIIELFQCLLNGYNNGIINYDSRKRDMMLEIDLEQALLAISTTKAMLNKTDKSLSLIQKLGDAQHTITTNYKRELLYNIEHCIHHQALIRVALKDLNQIEIHENFGVAYATVAYRKQCAQ